MITRYYIKDLLTGNYIDWYRADYFLVGMIQNVRNMYFNTYEEAEKWLADDHNRENMLDDIGSLGFVKIEQTILINEE